MQRGLTITITRRQIRPGLAVPHRRRRGVVIGLATASLVMLAACGGPDRSGVALDADAASVSGSAAPLGGDVGAAADDSTSGAPSVEASADPDSGQAADGTAAAASLPTHIQWFGPFRTDLTDPTPSKTFTYHCLDNKSSGGVALFPYIVIEGSGLIKTRAYRTDGTSAGVKVSADTVATGQDELKLIVTSDHTSGDYQLSVSYACQADDPSSQYTTGDPTVTAVTGQTATVSVPFISSSARPVPIQFRADYGPAEGNYPSYTPWTAATLPKSGTQAETMTITGLQPGTTYHYRIRSNQLNYQNGPQISGPSFNGPDLTFTTAAS